MLKKLIAITAIGVACAWPACAWTDPRLIENSASRGKSAPVFIQQDVINEIPISNQEINRIVSDVKILNIKMDENASITADPNGENGFFIQMSGTKKELIYISTEDVVYTVRLKPSDIPAQTLKLKAASKQSALPIIGNEREKVAVRLIKAAFAEDEILKKARISEPSEEMNLIQNIEIKKYRRYDFDEDNLYLLVYIVKLTANFEYDEYKVSEKNFLLPELCENTIGLSLSRDYLTKKDYTRLFIVGRNGQ